MLRSIYEVQRDYALSSGLDLEVTWDALGPDQADILKTKIEILFPCNETNVSAIEQLRSELFNTIWEQRKYTNGVLLSSILYVMVTDEKNHNLAMFSTKFTCHPVFRTRKCQKRDGSAGCCMLFIDEHARVYQNWTQFLTSNVLPPGTMVAPSNGVYNLNNSDEVELVTCQTPNSTICSQMVRATDKVVNFGGLLATVPFVATLATPVAAPIMLAASAVAMSTAAYTTLRSAMTLRDRCKHAKSVALTDSEARGSWLGVAGGLAGIGSTGVTKALSSLTSNGRKVSLATKLAVNGMNVSSLVLSGTGIVNGVHDLYMKKSLTSLNALHLASGLIIFTHSLNNHKIASKILKKDNNSSSVLDAVKNQSRKVFENIKLHGSNGKSDLIRPFDEIPFKDNLMSLINGQIHFAAVGVIAVPASFLQPFIIDISGQKLHLDLGKLAQEFGPKFVQHIGDPQCLLNVLIAMGTSLRSPVCRLLMDLANQYITSFVNTCDRALQTFFSTETIIYKILMQYVRKYRKLAYQCLKSKTTEIFDEIEKYFNSLNPINSMNLRYTCHICNGSYYLSP